MWVPETRSCLVRSHFALVDDAVAAGRPEDTSQCSTGVGELMHPRAGPVEGAQLLMIDNS